MYSNEIKKEIIPGIIDYIESNGIENEYLCDIAHNVYNMDYYLLGFYQCKEWIKEYFDDMLTVIEYWEEETGDDYAKYITKDIEKLVSLIVYTVADWVLYDIYDELEIDSNELCDKDCEYLILETLKDTLDIL